MKPLPETAAVEARFPTSVAQERCWVMEQIHPGNKGLNLAIRWQLRGPAPENLVEAAFQSVVDRHEILRTRFVEADGQVLQEVVASVPFRLIRFDLRTVPPADQPERIHQIAVEHASERFDLAEPLLLRVAMVRTGPDRADLLIAVHNAIFDGFSIGVLGTEFGTALAALIEGREPDLPALPLHYGDYALWQRDYAASPAMQEEEDYWCNHLRGMSYFEVPGARPRRAGEPEVGRLDRLLPAEFRTGLEEMSKRLGVSVFSLGTAALTAALARHTGRDEVSFAFQDSGRDDVDLEPLIGIFTNPLVLRLPVAAQTSLEDLAHASRQTIEQALANRHLPFDRLVQRLNPPRDPLRIPLVSIMFNLQKVFLVERSYGPIEMVSVPSHSPGTMYDLNINVIGRKTGWKLMLDYNRALYDEAQIADLAETFIAALTGLATRPQQLVRDLPGPMGAAPQVEDSAQLAASEVAAAPVMAAPVPPAAPEALKTPDLAIPAAPMPAPPDLGDDFQQLKAIWAEVLSLPAEKVDGDFFDLGGYSVLALRMLARAGARFGSRPSLYQFLADPTLRGVAALLNIDAPDASGVSAAPAGAPPAARDDGAARSGVGASLAAASGAVAEVTSKAREIWTILPLRKAGPEAPVLLTINQTFLYQTISRDLTAPAQVANLVIADPAALALEGQLGFDAAMEAAADLVVEAYGNRPLALCGLCVDGRLALRLALALERRGHRPDSLAMIDTWAPGASAKRSTLSKASDRWRLRLKRAGHYCAEWAGGRMKTRDVLRQFGPLRALLRNEPPEPDMSRLIKATVDQLVGQTRRYQFEPYAGHVILFATDAQTTKGHDGLWGWAKLLPADTSFYRVSGWHGDALSRLGFDRIAQVLDARLHRLTKGGSG